MKHILFFFLMFIAALTILPSAAATYECTVYRDGYVHVDHELTLLSLEATIYYEPVGWPLELCSVTDQTGAPLIFDTDDTGIIIHVLGADSITISYDTAQITSKEGAFWTLYATFEDETTFMLPDGATIIYADPLPDEIDLDGNALKFGEGTVELSYVLAPLSDDTEQGGGSWLPIVAVAGAVILIAAIIVRMRGNRKPTAWKPLKSLDALENRVMAYVVSEGPLLESEIRNKFDIPKTSSWRMMKRLEEQGLIRIEQKNRSNIVSFRKKA